MNQLINHELKLNLEINNNHPDYPSTKDLRSSTLFSTPEAILAIKEFYGIVMNYMCDKYPTCFKIQEDENLIYNLITNKNTLYQIQLMMLNLILINYKIFS